MTGRRRLRNPSLGRISLYVLRDVFHYSCFNYKVSGLMLISLITWGVKRGNLKLISGLLLPYFILNYVHTSILVESSFTYKLVILRSTSIELTVK